MGYVRAFVENRGDTLTFFIALASFVISVVTFVLNNALNPDVDMEVGPILRVNQEKAEGRAYVDIQPTVVSIGRSTRVEVLRDFTLEVTPMGDQASVRKPTKFEWQEYGKLETNIEEEPTLTYVFVGNPAPLVVSPTEPQSPILRLKGRDDWYFKAGKYQMTLIATPTVEGWPKKLKERFNVSFTQDEIEQLHRAPEKRNTAMELTNVKEPTWYRFVEWIS